MTEQNKSRQELTNTHTHTHTRTQIEREREEQVSPGERAGRGRFLSDATRMAAEGE